MVAQVIKTFYDFYGICRISPLFTSASHWSVSWSSWMQHTHKTTFLFVWFLLCRSFRGPSLDTGNVGSYTLLNAWLLANLHGGNVQERWDGSSTPEPPKLLYQLSSLRSDFTMLQPTTMAHAVRLLIHFQKIPGSDLSRAVLLCHSSKVAGVVAGHDLLLPCSYIFIIH